MAASQVIGIVLASALLTAAAPGSETVRLGRATDAILRDTFPVLDEPEITARVAEIGQRVVAAAGNLDGYEFTFTVLNDATPNAMTSAAGHIFVTSGLLATLQSEAELAAVLGHEVGHVNERHITRSVEVARRRNSGLWQILAGLGGHLAGAALQTAVGGALGSTGSVETQRLNDQIASQLGSLASMAASGLGLVVLNQMSQGYGDSQEFAADALAVQYAAAAGYAPEALIQVMERLLAIDVARDTSGPISYLHARRPLLKQRMLRAKALRSTA